MNAEQVAGIVCGARLEAAEQIAADPAQAGKVLEVLGQLTGTLIVNALRMQADDLIHGAHRVEQAVGSLPRTVIDRNEAKGLIRAADLVEAVLGKVVLTGPDKDDEG